MTLVIPRVHSKLGITSFCKERSLEDSMVFVPSFSFILSHHTLLKIYFTRKKSVSDNTKGRFIICGDDQVR